MGAGRVEKPEEKCVHFSENKAISLRKTKYNKAIYIVLRI